MFNKIKKIDKRGNEYFVSNVMGFVVRMKEEDYLNMQKYGDQKMLLDTMPPIIKDLADANILVFENYTPNQSELQFDDVLVKSSDDLPIYKAPIIAHLGITNRCNMGCKYCTVRNIHTNSTELTTDEYKKIIDELVDWGVFQIGFTGGEPTVREDLVDLVRYISGKHVASNVTSNGWNISDDLVDELVEAGLTQMQFSLDSHIKEKHERFRNINSYDKVLSVAKKFKDKGVIVGFDTVVTNENLDDLIDTVKFLDKAGYDGITLLKLKQGYFDEETFKRLVPEYKKYGKIIDQICKLDTNIDISLDCGSVCNLCMTLTDEEADSLHSAGCPAGHTLIHIAANGDVYPCSGLSLEKFKLGNVLEERLVDIWNKNPLLKNLRNIKNLVKGKCKNCPKINNCRCGCRSVAYSYGDLYGSDETCHFC